MQPNFSDLLVALATIIVVCYLGVTLPNITIGLLFMIFWNFMVVLVITLFTRKEFNRAKGN
jgi:hypothetical protein